MSKKIKVAGYTKKINYTDGISYRPFSTLNKHLEDGTVFSAGNFNVTVNTDQHKSKLFKTKEFSDYFDLNNLQIDEVKLSSLYESLKKTKLNLNTHLLKNYAYFGSLKERVRVSLEKIIINFPAAFLYQPNYYDDNFNVVHSGSIKDIDVLDIDETMIVTLDNSSLVNPYDINIFESNHNGLLFNSVNKWRDFTKTYDKYSLIINGNEHNIIGLYENGIGQFRPIIKYDEELFLNYESNNDNVVYVRPNKYEIESFYQSLDSLELELLNQNTNPKNTYNFIVREFKDNGIFIETNKSGTWTTSDGYNLDFDNNEYLDYVTNLINICDDIDNNSGNLIIRQMVTTSLLEFDTVSSDVNNNVFDSSQKIKSILSIYGRNFDNTKNYIDGIAFANSITYDKEDNAPDKYLREIAKSFGWDIFENQHYLNLYEDTLGKDKDGYTKEELDNELWRRLIINTPFLWKSKGTRKAIEFIIKLLGIPRGMISFNEFVYKATNMLNYNEVQNLVNMTPNEQTIFDLPIDTNGFPRVHANNDNMYYQKAGGWYSITGGENSDIDTNLGNNPHMGGYDSGVAFLNQFKNIIDGFEPIKETSEDKTITELNLFKSFNNGRFENIIETDFSSTPDATALVEDKFPLTVELDDCGCEVGYKLKELQIKPIARQESFDCDYEYTVYTDDGKINFYNGVTQLPLTQECCEMINGQYIYDYTNSTYVCAYRSIIDCGRYRYIEPSGGFAVFLDLETNENVTTVPYVECCPTNSTPIGDPISGYQCQVGIDVSNMCVFISSVSLINTQPTGETFIEYVDAEASISDRVYMINQSTQYPINVILDKNENVGFGYHGIFSEIQGNYFLQSTGSMLTNINNLVVDYTISTHPKTPTFRMVISYVDCPPQINPINCLKLEYLTSSNREYLMNLNLSYISEIKGSNVTVVNQIPTSDTPSRLYFDNGYNLDIASRNSIVKITRNGTVYELNLNDIVNIKQPVLNDGLLYGYEFTLLGQQYTFYFRYIDCPECINYTTYSFISGTAIIGQNIQIAQFSDPSTSSIFTSVMNAECCPTTSDAITHNGLIYCRQRTTLPSFKLYTSTSSSSSDSMCLFNVSPTEPSMINCYTQAPVIVGNQVYNDIYGTTPKTSGFVTNTFHPGFINGEKYAIKMNPSGIITELVKCASVPSPNLFFANGEYLKITGGMNVSNDGGYTLTHYEIQYRLMSSSGSWTSFNVNYQAFISSVFTRNNVPVGIYTVRCRLVTNTNEYSNWMVEDNVTVTGIMSEIVISDTINDPCISFPPVKAVDRTAYIPVESLELIDFSTPIYLDPELTVKYTPVSATKVSMANLRGNLVLDSVVDVDGKLETIDPCGFVATPVRIATQPLELIDGKLDWERVDKIEIYNNGGLRVDSKFFLDSEFTQSYEIAQFNGKYMVMQLIDNDNTSIRKSLIEDNTIFSAPIPFESVITDEIKVNISNYYEDPTSVCQSEVEDYDFSLYSSDLNNGTQLYTDPELTVRYEYDGNPDMYLKLSKNDIVYSSMISKTGTLENITICE